MSDFSVHWFPQPRQMQALNACGLDWIFTGEGTKRDSICETIGYGGAAFGGKSDGLLGIAIAAAFAYPGISIGYFRRTYPELEGAKGAIIRSQELLAGITSYNEQKHTHLFPTGSRLHFCHCNTEKDVYEYQSQAFDILLVDEATHFTWSIIDYLITRNRSTIEGGCRPFRVFASNPGNVGHSWYLGLFDLLKAQGEHGQVKNVMNQNSKYEQTYFIPAFIADNAIGVERDPDYENRLKQRDIMVAKALLDGDWTVFSGQAFPQWNYSVHTIEPFEIPDSWSYWRSLDYGWDHPTYNYWWTMNPNNNRHYVIREWHARQLTDLEIANAIKTSSLPNERYTFFFASPDMWRAKNVNGIVTTAPDEFMRMGLILTKADNDRVSGKRKFNNLLAPLSDGLPGLQVFRSCPDLIACMPSLVKDIRNPEDVLKIDGDDPYDAARYGLTNSLITRPTALEQQPRRTRSPLAEVF